MAYTNPTTRTTGELITATKWNTDLVANIEWLARDHWRAAMRHTVAQSIPNGVVTKINYNSITYDFGGMANLASDTFTVPATFPTGITTALVELTANISLAAAGGLVRLMTFDKNASRITATRFSQVTSDLSLSYRTQAVAGDVFECFVFQDSGGAINTAPGSTEAVFSIRWVAWQN